MKEKTAGVRRKNPVSEAMLTRRTLLAAVAGAGVAFHTQRARAAEFSLKLGDTISNDYAVNVRFREAAEKIAEESDGRVELLVFTSGQLGNDGELLSQVRSGAIDFYCTSGLILGGFVPLAGIPTMGFAFHDYDTIWRAMDGALGDIIRTAIAEAGLQPVTAPFDLGFRQITNSRAPINTVGDVAGMKIRVPPAPVLVSMFEAFGAAPATIGAAEVYTALQTKVVDGQENPLSIIEPAKWYEVQKYCSLTSHLWDAIWLVTNPSTWDGLPPDVQDIVQRNLDAIVQPARDDIVRIEKSAREHMSAAGLAFNEVSDLNSFRERLNEVKFYDDWKAKFGDENWAVLEEFTGKLG